MARSVVIVGGGIVGISAAHALAGQAGIRVTVLDRDPQEPRGSTFYAPGFVGLYNDVPALTDLARSSAEVYDNADHGFRRSGGLELATSRNGATDVERRVEAARAAGLPADLLRVSDLPHPVAHFVDTTEVMAIGHFPDDGSADVRSLSRSLRGEAISRGARFLPDNHVLGIDSRGAQHVVATASGGRFAADDIVLAGGIWGPDLAGLVDVHLPLFPVAHPYVYGGRAPSGPEGPFVRWPDRHVYARVHGDRLGIGTYDHVPLPVTQADLSAGAGLPWTTDLDPVVTKAQDLLKVTSRFPPEERVKGAFAMTPDNLPFLGRHPHKEDIWIAQAIWVTHAAGAAQNLARAMVDSDPIPDELDIARFKGDDPEQLRENALTLYRDIYTHETE